LERSAIQAIKRQHQLEGAGFKTASNLEDLLFSLDDDQISSVVGFLLSDTDAVEILIKIIKNSINLENVYKVCICGGKLSHYIVSRQYFF
jgi:hypothetical protein